MFGKFFYIRKEASLVGVGSHRADGAGKAQSRKKSPLLSTRNNAQETMLKSVFPMKGGSPKGKQKSSS